MLDQQIRSLLIAAVARSPRSGIHVVAESAVYAMTLGRAKRRPSLAWLAAHAERGSVHERGRFLHADQMIGADHHHWKSCRHVAPKRIRLQRSRRGVFESGEPAAIVAVGEPCWSILLANRSKSRQGHFDKLVSGRFTDRVQHNPKRSFLNYVCKHETYRGLRTVRDLKEEIRVVLQLG